MLATNAPGGLACAVVPWQVGLASNAVIMGAALGIWLAILLIGAGVAAYCLRRHHGSLVQGAQLAEDLRRREQQVLELNDTVLQGLVVAKMALDLEQPVRANEALATSIASASRIITGLLGDQHHSLDLLRNVPAAVGAPEPASVDLERNPR